MVLFCSNYELNWVMRALNEVRYIVQGEQSLVVTNGWGGVKHMFNARPVLGLCSPRSLFDSTEHETERRTQRTPPACHKVPKVTPCLSKQIVLSCLSLTTHLTRFCFAGSPVSDARCMQSLVEEGSRVRWLQFFCRFWQRTRTMALVSQGDLGGRVLLVRCEF